MSHRTLYLLFAASSLAGTGLLVWAGFVGNVAVGDPGAAKLLTSATFLGAGGVVYFLIQAFSTKPRESGPAFQFYPSPEVTFEYSAAEGAPSTSATAEDIRAALAAGKGFTVADDPRGWVLLTGTIGPPRWVKNLRGDVVGEKQYARLTLRPGADTNALHPEDVSLVSTESNLTVNASRALVAALGPLRLRIGGDDLWLSVTEGVFSLLVVRLLQTRPIEPFSCQSLDRVRFGVVDKHEDARERHEQSG
jgi:hypothetical protein